MLDIIKSSGMKSKYYDQIHMNQEINPFDLLKIAFQLEQEKNRELKLIENIEKEI